ncbi:MAG: phosphatase PAP2 family protein [Pseudomonadota bacterium]
MSGPLLDGLEASRDGLIGLWNGQPDRQVPQRRLSKGAGDIWYASETIRGDLLVYDLTAGVTVDAGLAQAEVNLPGGPPLVLCCPDLDFFKQQMPLVRTYADLRGDRMAEIDTPLDDILSYFGGFVYLDVARRRQTVELLSAAVDLCIYVEMRIKHGFAVPRPIDFDPRIHPMIDTPTHGAFPSGHATEAFAVAGVLHCLLTGGTVAAGVAAHHELFQLAHRIATNRTVAGVHYPADSAAGAILGCGLADYVLAQAGAPAGSLPLKLAAPGGEDGAVFGPTDDFTLGWLAEAMAGAEAVETSSSIDRPILKSAWARAAQEFALYQPPAVAE